MSNQGGAVTGTITLLAPALRNQNPCLSLREIAVLVSKTTGEEVSRQRIYQVLKKAGVKTRGKVGKKFICNNCGIKFPSEGGKRTVFCGRPCYRDYYTVTLECVNCKTLFKRSSYQARHSLLHPNHKGSGPFCSPKCFGQYMGNNHGFRVHPENALLGSKALKEKRAKRVASNG